MKKTYYISAAVFLAALFLSFTSISYFLPFSEASPGLIAGTGIVLIALLWYVSSFQEIISAWPKPKKISLAIFLPLFSALATFSLKGEQEYLIDGQAVVIAVIYLGFFLTIAVVALAIIRFLLNLTLTKKQRSVSLSNIFLYMLPMLVASLLMFVAFYPAGMSPDSLSQWEQAKVHRFSDWHPVMFTWTIMLLTMIWDSPAIIALFQIALLSLTMGYMGYLMKRFHVNAWVIWAVLIGAAIMPTSAILSIIIWKDVIYSVALLFFSLMIFLLVKTNGEEVKKGPFLALFLVSSFVLVFFRHNGFPVYVVTMIFMIAVYRHAWKRLLPAALAIIIIHQIITGPVYAKLEVEESDPNEALSIPTQQIANIVVNNGEMTEAQRTYVNRLMPLEMWKEKYNPYAVDPIKFSGKYYDRTVIFSDWPGYFKIWGQLVMQNPGLAIEAFLKETSIVWQMNQPADAYMSRYVTTILPDNKFELVNKVINPDVTEAALSHLEFDTTAKEAIWRPAVYTFLTILLLYVAYLRNDWRIWLVLLPIALNTAAVTVAIPAQDFRYLYGNVLFFYAAIFLSLITYIRKDGEQFEKN